MSEGRRIEIGVPVLTRVEGEGALDLVIEGGQITDLKLRIYEPPRLFEKFLEGRAPQEVLDMVARICGICPVAYQMSAVQAMEAAFGIEPGPTVRRLRRVLYCGEWIQSHALHIHLLAAPDFLGFDSVAELAGSYPDAVRRGFELQALGNGLISLFGGRSVHPVGLRVGGFHRLPDADAREAMAVRIQAALPQAEALLRWTLSLDLPDVHSRFTSLALRHPTDYAIEAGRIVTDTGLDFPSELFAEHVREFQVPHSTARHALLDGSPYLVGPLARLNINQDRLPNHIRAVIEAGGMRLPSDNMFHSIVARAAEIWLALEEALHLLGLPDEPSPPETEPGYRAGIGFGATEAPRGLLWHRYQFDESGRVMQADIVPPTAQNQARIEADLRESLTTLGLDREPETLRRHAETVIRNYDPCISCATHFLRLNIERADT